MMEEKGFLCLKSSSW